MTMTDERLAELDAVMAKASPTTWHLATGAIGVNPWISCGNWTRHDGEYQRGGCILNMVAHDNREDDAAAIVALHNAYPDLRAHIDAQAATIARLESELEKTTHPHFWWDVDDGGNGCDDITSILENYEIGEVVELSCARDLPNQWAVGYVTESGGFRGQDRKSVV